MTDAEGALFERAGAHVSATYAALLTAVAGFGPFLVEPKKTSIHLVAATAFAGVHPQRSKLRLNIRADHRIESPRLRRVEQVSARRFHNELDLAGPDAVDDELVAWLRDAYALGAAARG